jgi:hypothetical protein
MNAQILIAGVVIGASSREQGLSDGNQPGGFFGGSLCTNSGHSLSMTAENGRDLLNLQHVLVQQP